MSVRNGCVVVAIYADRRNFIFFFKYFLNRHTCIQLPNVDIEQWMRLSSIYEIYIFIINFITCQYTVCVCVRSAWFIWPCHIYPKKYTNTHDKWKTITLTCKCYTGTIAKKKELSQSKSSQKQKKSAKRNGITSMLLTVYYCFKLNISFQWHTVRDCESIY